MYTNVHNKFIHNNQRMEMTHLSTKKWWKDNDAFAHNMEYYSLVQENRVLVETRPKTNLEDMVNRKSHL